MAEGKLLCPSATRGNSTTLYFAAWQKGTTRRAKDNVTASLVLVMYK
jgi:hypothetical protein